MFWRIVSIGSVAVSSQSNSSLNRLNPENRLELFGVFWLDTAQLINDDDSKNRALFCCLSCNVLPEVAIHRRAWTEGVAFVVCSFPRLRKYIFKSHCFCRFISSSFRLGCFCCSFQCEILPFVLLGHCLSHERDRFRKELIFRAVSSFAGCGKTWLPSD